MTSQRSNVSRIDRSLLVLFVVSYHMTVTALEAFGLERMSDQEIRAFLANQGMGVLGLPDDDSPYMLPMSYGFDGGSTLYFTYVLGEGSRKARLSDRAEEAGFLIYSAKTMFTWESVFLTGAIERVDEDDWDDLGGVLQGAWRPALLEEAVSTAAVDVYRFEIADQSGIKHTGLPPGLGSRD